MEHGLKYITFYVQKHIAHHAMWYSSPLVRDKPLGAPGFGNGSIVSGLYYRQGDIAVTS